MTKQFDTPRVKIQHPWKQPGSNLSQTPFQGQQAQLQPVLNTKAPAVGEGWTDACPGKTLADRVSFPAGFWGMLRAPNLMMLFLVSLFVLLLGNLT